jgi:hypothetical protein
MSDGEQPWREKYPYINNMNIGPLFIGCEALFNPFVERTSSGRVDMYSSHINQAMVLEGADFPFISTGWEHNLGQYQFTKSERTQDAHILAYLPKYSVGYGIYQIRENPSWTVIYRGLEDNKIHYFTICNYNQSSDGFGYENVIRNTHLLEKGTAVPKEIEFVTSPIHKGAKYCLGVNANVAYMTTEETIEDAFSVRRGFIEKMKTLSVSKKHIKINVNQHPLNLYGNDEEFKFLPDIGETVGSDGILCAFRRLTDSTFASDVAGNELRNIQYAHDDTVYASPGSKILDIDFYVGRPTQKQIHSQIEKYQDAINRYWQSIIKVYKEFGTQYELSKEFITLVSTAMERLVAAGVNKDIPHKFKNKVKLINKDNQPIEYIEFVVTYSTVRPVSLGFKSTDRHGCTPNCQ